MLCDPDKTWISAELGQGASCTAVVLAHSRLGLSWCGSSDKLQSLSQFSEELGVQAPRWKGGAQFLFQSHLGVPG